MSPADSPFASLPAPGPHPATTELRAYAAGTLAPAEQQRIEAHMLDCERCADLVDGFSMTDDATTDHAVATLRSRLQARVGNSAPKPLASPNYWPRVAAAAALLGVVAGGIWTWEQREPASSTATARLEQTAPAVAVEPSPSPAQAPEATSAPSGEAPAASAPKASQADYSAGATAPPARAARRGVGRAASRAAASRSNRTVVADREVSADAVDLAAAPSADGWASTQTVAKPAAAASQAENESVDKSESVAKLEEKSGAADTASTANGYSAARAAKKAKSFSTAPAAAPSANGGATARVLATPMPGAIAIKPAPIGGTSALRDYLRREAMEFEPENNALRLTGTVRLKFTVGADGKVSDLKVTRGLRDDYDAEAIRMVCEGPAWQPGVAGGRRAPLPMELNVTF